ncbi:hypothetical protein ACVWXO_002106 [Bradyrhizobium sp. LM2.7]
MDKVVLVSRLRVGQTAMVLQLPAKDNDAGPQLSEPRFSRLRGKRRRSMELELGSAL